MSKIDRENVNSLTLEKKKLIKEMIGKYSTMIDFNKIRDSMRNSEDDMRIENLKQMRKTSESKDDYGLNQISEEFYFHKPIVMRGKEVLKKIFKEEYNKMFPLKLEIKEIRYDISAYCHHIILTTSDGKEILSFDTYDNYVDIELFRDIITEINKKYE